MTINQKIFKLLDEKGIKQAQLAQCLNVQKSVVTNWKQRGNNPPVEYIVPICKLLNVSLNELFEDYIENDFDSELLTAYHAAEIGTQKAVCKLLDLEQEVNSSNLFTSKIG